MSSTDLAASANDSGAATPRNDADLRAARGTSPNQRAWARFRRNRLGHASLWLFIVLLVVTTLAELVSNDLPYVARIDGQLIFPIIDNPSEQALGGDFITPTDWKDPFITQLLAQPGNWAVGAPNPHSATSIDYFAKLPPPAAPSAENVLGTDSQGRDMLARLVYGFRVSIWFALALTITGTVIGVAMGALMGYFGGRIDLTLQRLIEIWGAIPSCTC
jgi:microcin C transport system permease protein